MSTFQSGDPSQLSPRPLASCTLFDRLDLQRLAVAAPDASLRHLLLAGVLALLHRHAELGPFQLALKLPPALAHPAAANSRPFACPVSPGQSFGSLLAAAALAETRTLAGLSRLCDSEPFPCRLLISTAGAPVPLTLLTLAGHLALVWDDPESLPAPALLAAFRRLRPLLQAAVADPACPVARLPLLTALERRQVLHEWNATEQPLPPLPGVHQLFESQVQRMPDACAITFGPRSISFGQLNARANQIAHRLRSADVGPDTVVGLCLERGPDLLAALLGILKAGGACLPLDPTSHPGQLADVLAESQASVLLTLRARVASFPHLPETVLCLDEEPIEILPDEDLINLAAATDVAWVVRTSGSADRPRGVQITHRALTNFLCSMADAPGLDSSDRVLALASPSLPWAPLELLLPLIVGARIMLAPGDALGDGAALLQVLKSTSPTLLQGTPALWQMLLQAGWRGTPGLRMICGGGLLTRDLARQLLLRGSELWHAYGLAETAGWCTVHRVDGDSSPVPVGRPVANTRVYLLDDQLQPVPPGLSGELFVAGASVARGLIARPDLEARHFLPDPFFPGPDQRMVGTGDLCRYRPDGQLEFLGRKPQPAHPAALDAEHDDSLLLPLQPSGSSPPVICLPDADNDVDVFRALLEFLPPDQPLLALRLPQPATPADVPAIAARLLRHLGRVHPGRPYRLVGLGLGGLVAYEMARQRKQQGGPETPVILLDTYGPDYPRLSSAARGRLGRWHHVTARMSDLARRLLPGAPAASAAGHDSGQPSAYAYPAHDGPVVLFRAMATPRRRGSSYDNIQNGWGTVVRSSIELYPVPCWRQEFFTQRQLPLWAPQLRELLLRTAGR